MSNHGHFVGASAALLLLFATSCSRQQPLSPPGQPRSSLRVVTSTQQSQTASHRDTPPPPLSVPNADIDKINASDEALASTWRAMDQALARNLQSEFPELAALLELAWSPSNDPKPQSSFFRLLQAAETAPPERRPLLLLAAERVGSQIFCASEAGLACQRLQDQFAEHHLTFALDELAAAWYFKHDLLWTLWDRYPETAAGQDAFALLLDHGWDTSGTCSKGSDQFREVIRQGEAFLNARPSTPRRLEVTFLLGEAYETWWSLSRANPNDGDEDAPDPARYREGAAQAWEKAVQLYGEIAKAAPKTEIGTVSQQTLSMLNAGHDTKQRKFYCVYD